MSGCPLELDPRLAFLPWFGSLPEATCPSQRLENKGRGFLGVTGGSTLNVDFLEIFSRSPGRLWGLSCS